MNIHIFKNISKYFKCKQVHRFLKVKNENIHLIMQEMKFRRLFITHENIKTIKKEAKFYKETLSDEFLKSMQFHLLIYVFMRDGEAYRKDHYYAVRLKRAEWISYKEAYYFMKFVDGDSFGICY